MTSFTATAPGKIILFGEHAVVYKQPAIAVPVENVRARAVVSANPLGKPGQMRIQAPGIGLDADLQDLPGGHPISQAVQLTLQMLKWGMLPACTMRITSTIPIAAGLGSGAAISVVIIRALSAFLGRSITLEQVSSLALEVEKIHHGTPSGIDNTVITFSKPVFFIRDERIEFFEVPNSFTIIIGDTGIYSPTAISVGDVQRLWIAEPGQVGEIFIQIGAIARQARRIIEQGDFPGLGALMDKNHELLQKLTVSSAELDHLVEVARQAGALGAKLSGGGRGGNMIALAHPEQAPDIARALQEAGAVQTINTQIPGHVPRRDN